MTFSLLSPVFWMFYFLLTFAKRFAAESWKLDVSGDILPSFSTHYEQHRHWPCALSSQQARAGLEPCSEDATPSDEKELVLHSNYLLGFSSEKISEGLNQCQQWWGVFIFHGVDTQLLGLVLRSMHKQPPNGFFLFGLCCPGGVRTKKSKGHELLEIWHITKGFKCSYVIYQLCT